MSPRTGRPKAEKPLTIEVKARIDYDTNQRLNDYCKKITLLVQRLLGEVLFRY